MPKTETNHRIKVGTVSADLYGNQRPGARCDVELELRIEHRTSETPHRTTAGESVTEYDQLAITGSVWMPSRRDTYEGGQNIDSIAAMLPHSRRVQKIAALWRRWHLNGMRPGCVHQGNPHEETPIVLVTYDLRTDVWQLQNRIRQNAIDALKRGEAVQWDTAELAVMREPLELVVGADQPAPPDASYVEKKRETKSPGWVLEKEHPRGVLSKPCAVCGYKYGSAWLVEPCPPEVIAEALRLFDPAPLPKED